MATPAPAFQLPMPNGVDPSLTAFVCPDSPRSVASDDDHHHDGTSSHDHSSPPGRAACLTSFADHTSGTGAQRRFEEVPASTTLSYRPGDDNSQSAHPFNNFNNANNLNMSTTRDHLAPSAAGANKLAPPPPPLALSQGALPQPADDFEGCDLTATDLVGASLLPPPVTMARRRTGWGVDAVGASSASPQEYRPLEVPSQRSGADSVVADSSPHPRSVAVRSEDASETTTIATDDPEARSAHPRHRALPPPPPKGSVLGGLPLGSGAALPVALPPSVLSQLGAALPSALLPPPRHSSMTSAHADFSDSDGDCV